MRWCLVKVVLREKGEVQGVLSALVVGGTALMWRSKERGSRLAARPCRCFMGLLSWPCLHQLVKLPALVQVAQWQRPPEQVLLVPAVCEPRCRVRERASPLPHRSCIRMVRAHLVMSSVMF